MENSAYEALIIGSNVLIFVLALTISINLMMNTREMSEKANDMIASEQGSLVAIQGDGSQEVGIPGISDELNTKRIYSGSEVMSYYMDNVTSSKYEMEIKLITEASAYTLEDIVFNKNRKSISAMNFILEYRGINAINGRIMFKFIQI